MFTIHEYPAQVVDDLIIMMPEGAQVLCVQMQNDIPCVWARVDDRRPLLARKFIWHGTGHDCAASLTKTYVGTVQFEEYVFHLFDCK